MKKDYKTIVVKVGSSSLTHAESGGLDLIKLEVLVRELTDLRNSGHRVILVTSGAIMVGRSVLMRVRKESMRSRRVRQSVRHVS